VSGKTGHIGERGEVMKVKAALIAIVLSSIVAVSVHASGIFMEGKILVPVTTTTVEGLAGDSYKTYYSVDNGTEVTVFRFKGIRIKSEAEEYNGSWIIDEGTGKVMIQRFDTPSTVALSLFTADDVDGYVMALKRVREDGQVALELLRLENGDIGGGVVVSKAIN
jgi:hypothetical protein